ncbi:hypothetical protein MMC28_009878 [Mycoblastus sanguinarius]|nr:hypothetical protein [Mycoblastus sanguinarius]
MTTYKNSNITDYFKRFAPPRPKKRPFPNDNTEECHSVRQLLRTPHGSQGVDPQSKDPKSFDEMSGTKLVKSNSIDPGSQASSGRHADANQVNPTPPDNDTSPPEVKLEQARSQTPALSSSQRMVKNGEVIVTNSDEDASSDTSLEDIDDLLEARKPSRGINSPPEPELPYLPSQRKADDEGGSSTKRPPRGSARANKVASPLRSALPVMTKYKFSLQALAKQRRQYEASKEGVAQANLLLESYEQRKAMTDEEGRIPSEKTILDVDLIKEVMKNHGDEDDISRLKIAIQRTEALNHSKIWSFFDDNSGESFEQGDFPNIENEPLAQILTEPPSRHQAFLSGYVGEYAMKQGLPEEVLLWIMDAVCLESRDDLRYSFTSSLKEAAKQITPLLTPGRIDALFRKMGATAAALDTERSVVPRAVLSESIEAVSRPNLLSILDLFRTAAGDMSSGSRIHIVCTLCRLALDHSISNDPHAISAIEESFASLVESIPDRDLDHEVGYKPKAKQGKANENSDQFQVVLTTVLPSIADTTLRLQLLQSIPAYPYRLAFFRQQLALAFFLGDNPYFQRRAQELVNLRIIARHLHQPQYIVNNTTDYAELAASISILSIGIDCGDPPSAPYTRDEETRFNSDVDLLAQRIKEMFTQIIDTSASSIRRTEAKEVLEGLHSRLMYAVRTKPKPKSMLFGNSTIGSAGDRGIIKAFLDGKKQSHLTTSTTITDDT